MVSMDLSTRESDGRAVVALRGELEVADAASVAAALVAVAAPAPGITRALAGLEFIRSPGGAGQGQCPRDGLASVSSACSAAEPERAAGSRRLAGRMTGSRPGRIWGLVAAQAAGRGGRVSAADACAAAVAAVGVTGAWLSAAGGGDAGHLMRVTDEVGEQLAELHLTLGQGPCLDAAASGGPVLASDLAGGESGRRWPVFALAARQAGAAAIFAFPLRIGAIRAGVLGLYQEMPGPLNALQLA